MIHTNTNTYLSTLPSVNITSELINKEVKEKHMTNE